MNNKIIEKIKKMLALANNAGATEGEADNALRMATKLLEKHNLSMTDLHTTEKQGTAIIGGIQPWQRTVVSAVTKLYGCAYFYDPDPDMKANFIIGTESDRVTASIIIKYIFEDINKAGKGKGVKFKNGAAQSFAFNCFELGQERNGEVTGTGLAVVDLYKTKIELAKEYMNSNMNLTTSKGRRSTTSEAGREYGRGLSPNARMSNKVALN